MKLKFNNKLIRTQGGSILTLKRLEYTEIKYGLLYNWFATQDQGGHINNIAPAGFRVPTEAEWEEEILSWSSNDADGAFGSVLKLTVGGYRDSENNLIFSVGSIGYYWSSTVDGVFARELLIDLFDSIMNEEGRSYGLSIRLIKDETYTGEAFTGGDFNGLTYQLVTNPTTGRVWLDRNLGATQVATSSTDSAAYGWLYQWGRGSDGHQLRDSETTDVLSNSDSPGHGDFITSDDEPFDWRSPQNDNLWQPISVSIIPDAMSAVGWGIPSDENWSTLITYLGGESVAGGKLKETGFDYWLEPNEGATNEVDFNLKAGGYREGELVEFVFSGEDMEAILRSSLDSDFLYVRSDQEVALINNEDIGFNEEALRNIGMSIRLVRNATVLEQDYIDGTPCDPYTGNDGKVYRTVKIGTQVWIADNLAETKWSNGTFIQGWNGSGRVIISNIDWVNLTTAAVCVYDNDINNM